MNAKGSIKAAMLTLPIVCTASFAWGAADCRSIAGQMNGQSVVAVRRVELFATSIILSGTLDGMKSPRHSLPCKALAKGVYCDAIFKGAIVTVMTNGRRMIETVADPTSKKEYASVVYECNRVMKP